MPSAISLIFVSMRGLLGLGYVLAWWIRGDCFRGTRRSFPVLSGRLRAKAGRAAANWNAGRESRVDCSERLRAVDVQQHAINRVRGADIKHVALLPAEHEVGADFRDLDLADQLAV